MTVTFRPWYWTHFTARDGKSYQFNAHGMVEAFAKLRYFQRQTGQIVKVRFYGHA